MKFHRQRTSVTSSLDGQENYERSFLEGTLRRVDVAMAGLDSADGVYRKYSVADLSCCCGCLKEPMEISGFSICARALVVDELTRHRSTFQSFIPVTSSIVVVVAPSLDGNPGRPNPERIVMVPVDPGEVLCVEEGVWHTLPFVFTSNVLVISVMHRESLDSYHDVRDLAAEGWVGVLRWLDPS